ncbi:TIGR03557 family F420-dependent LLM class oxidoreductase [Natronorubrum sp. JWXQ-INN-674]|uniref:TIGR03557 family F420-dependent LLM class oxidoreductase n=1 Tax=Natronorubrum halalkaliphilum TaxID=2691917 RepID=A0A6B0VFL6_9EURY|nr:TIGR03557 family F420-dependent LLM class oxidoreductase [Natronorubrum halalkaliphilum]MXV60561.1 TIGR03557 family F420-dependent LLM class oxidoreductase [Natronorubrum halalkaliphilum]
MDIGYFAAHEQYGPSKLLEHVERAENAGFDTVWTSDHIHPWWHTDAHCGAAWPWMGSALERTESVRVGTGVTPPIGRSHPGMIAQTFGTLGAMYPGRVHLALGTGEAMNEVPLGYEWPEYSERRKRLIDACEIITRLWDGEFTDYDGHYWDVNTMRLYTLPDEDARVPLLVAGNGPKTTTVAGRYADGFLTLRDVDFYHRVLEPALETGAEDAGRDPDTISRTRQLLISYDPDYDRALESTGFWRGPPAIGFDQEIYDPREIEAAGREMPIEEMADEFFIATDPAEIREQLARLENAGFDEVELLSSSPDQEKFIETMESEVLGRF